MRSLYLYGKCLTPGVLLAALLAGSIALPAYAVPPKDGLSLQKTEKYEVSVNGMLRAIEKGDVEAVTMLLDKGAKVNDNEVVPGGDNPFLPPRGGDTPLIRAVQRGHVLLVKLLLNRGAEVDIPNPRTRVTALHYASARGDLALTRLLFEHGAKPNVSDSFGETPLMDATQEGQLEVMHLLLEQGANPDVQDKWGRTALMIVMDPPVGLVHRLEEPLTNPILRLNITKALLAKRANLNLRNREGYTALMLALERGDIFLSYLLEEAGASTEGAQEARLFYATESSDLEEVEALLAKGANPNARNRYGHTPLMQAAPRGSVAIAKTLLMKGAEVNAQSQSGTTALMLATSHPFVAKLLLEAGADVHRKNISGDTVFFFALRRGHPDVVQMLLERGFDAQAQLDKYPPLLWAAKYLNVGAARVLLERGANIHATDRYSNTALHHVMRNEGDQREVLPMLELLLARGADINARNKAGETPLRLALRDPGNVTPEDIRFLRERGAVGDTAEPGKDKP